MVINMIEFLSNVEYLAIVVGFIALIYAGILTYLVLKSDKGSKQMQKISGAIEEGANAFLLRQYKTLLPIVFLLILLIGYFININTSIAFAIGVFSSALAGYIGMQVAVRGNVRVAEAAKKGLPHALSIAYKGGTVTGMALAGLGLIGVSAIYLVFGDLAPLAGYGFGASLISLFARVGGGIYTKAADVGADLVGKIEKNIPEDDPRNPAVIADNVGDNVGDCAGMSADVFESFVVTVIATMLLGFTLKVDYLVMLPLALASLGVLSSIIGTLFVGVGKGKNPKIMNAFYKGIVITALVMVAIS